MVQNCRGRKGFFGPGSTLNPSYLLVSLCDIDYAYDTLLGASWSETVFFYWRINSHEAVRGSLTEWVFRECAINYSMN